MEFLTLTLGPSLILLWYFHRSDRFPEPHGVVWATFALGVATVVPILIYTAPLAVVLESLALEQHYLMAAGWAVFGAAIPEEFCKFLVVYFYCRRHSDFDEPMDGLVYGVAASLGFAALENVLYVLDEGLWVALPRAITAVPMHAAMGAIMGYYVGAAHFNSACRTSLLRQALAGAHATARPV